MLAALERAAGGEFAAVLVAGDAGVGKSRLLRELGRAAEERGARVLVGDCVSYSEGGFPYAPVRSALGRLVRELDPARLDGLLGSGRDELARLVPELGAPGSSPPEELRTVPQVRLFDLLLGLLARLSEEAPVLLAVEDVHWADRSTLDFLAFLIANARRERLLLTCSYRTDEVHRGHRLRSFLAQHETRPHVDRLELGGFTPEELGTQLKGILGGSPDPALVRRVYARSEGNAFFTEELLAASADGTELPDSLRDALMLRIEVLPEHAQQVLRIAAAHGRVVPHRLLAAVSDLPDWELHGALREAVTRHVLVRHDEESYAFRHALLQETLESDLLPGERAGIHLTLAQAIEGDPTLVAPDGRAAAELYVHWRAAGRLPAALAAALRAGVEAEQIYAFGAASDHFRRVGELWNKVDDAETCAGMDEVTVGMRAAECAYLAGDGEAAIGLISAAGDKVDAATDRYRAALVRERLGVYMWWARGDMEGSRSALAEAVELLPAHESGEERARVLATLAGFLMLDGRTAESVQRCEQAIAVARQVGAGVAEAHALNTLGVNLGDLGDRATGIEHLRRSMQMSEELGDIDNVGRAFHNLADALDQDGRVEEAVELALMGARRAAEAGLRERRLLLEAEAGMYLAKLGRLEEAERLTAEALELGPSLAKLHQCANRARVEIQRGSAREAEVLVEAAPEATAGRPGAHYVEPLASARVELELLRGHPDEARRSAEQTLEHALDRERVLHTARLHSLGARACAQLAERARAAGDEPAAADAVAGATALLDRLERQLAPDGRRGPPPSETLAYHELCASEAQRAAGTATAAGWEAVADRWAKLGMPLEHAYARLREAECRIVEGQPKRAEQVLAIGLRITTQAGAHWLQGQLESLARRGRLSLPDERRADVAPTAVERLGLTDREVAVLELVALGKTNRQIGEELFMAQKTASVHVSRILTKLGVRSRVEAATAAQRLGIVP